MYGVIAPVQCVLQVPPKMNIRNNGMIRIDRISYHSKAIVPHRSFCTLSNLASEEWPEHEFVKIAEACLEYISEIVSEIGYQATSELSDFDIGFSQGVLTINLGDQGIYVLNTQSPNRQIWMSSPKSGPWRYSWNHEERQWISTRDGHALSSRLSNELSVVLKEPVLIEFGNVTFEDN